MLKKTALTTLLALAGFGLAACDVEQTREANVDLPEYQVEKTEGGSVTPPQVEMAAPDVNVTEQKESVEVPTIRTEERTVEVPNIDVEPAQEGEAAAEARTEDAAEEG